MSVNVESSEMFLEVVQLHMAHSVPTYARTITLALMHECLEFLVPTSVV